MSCENLRWLLNPLGTTQSQQTFHKMHVGHTITIDPKHSWWRISTACMQNLSLLSQTEPKRFVIIKHLQIVEFSVQNLLIFLHGAIGIAHIRYHAYTYLIFSIHVPPSNISHRNGSIGHRCVYHSNIRIYSNILCEYSNSNFDPTINVFFHVLKFCVGVGEVRGGGGMKDKWKFPSQLELFFFYFKLSQC